MIKRKKIHIPVHVLIFYSRSRVITVKCYICIESDLTVLYCLCIPGKVPFVKIGPFLISEMEPIIASVNGRVTFTVLGYYVYMLFVYTCSIVYTVVWCACLLSVIPSVVHFYSLLIHCYQFEKLFMYLWTSQMLFFFLSYLNVYNTITH